MVGKGCNDRKDSRREYTRKREVLQHGVSTLPGPLAVEEKKLAATARNTVEVRREYKEKSDSSM